MIIWAPSNVLPSYVWYTVIAFGGIATISSYFTIDYGQYFTDTVARKLQHQSVEMKSEVKV